MLEMVNFMSCVFYYNLIFFKDIQLLKFLKQSIIIIVAIFQRRKLGLGKAHLGHASRSSDPDLAFPTPKALAESMRGTPQPQLSAHSSPSEPREGTPHGIKLFSSRPH